MDLLIEKPRNILEFFLKDYKNQFDININKTREMFKNKILWNTLTKKWYKNLREDNLSEAYTVYKDHYYFVDLFNCFKLYSRTYLKRLQKEKSLKDISSFVDIGCGIGYSTWALKQMFPKAEGYATDINQTDQWIFCCMIACRAKFKMLETFTAIPNNIDLIFASEYFEHIFNPIEHLKQILKCSPKYFVIANSFNTKSIGHFRYYKHEGKLIHESKISRLFNRFMIDNHYHKEGHAWNDRPIIWRKNES